MPRVGSSKISTFGLASIHFARTTFCWLPPLRFFTFCSMLRVLMFILPMYSRENALSCTFNSYPRRLTALILAMDVFSRMAISRNVNDISVLFIKR